MPKLGSHHHQRGVKGMSSRPRDLALLALEALARYKHGIARPGEHKHEPLARRLARVAAQNSWE